MLTLHTTAPGKLLHTESKHAHWLLQEALERHQRLFVWDTTGAGGIYSMVEKELALRAQSRAEVQSVMRR